jgi:hypothetical protein
MPYKLRKAPRKDLYWVVTIETGKKHSKDPIPKDKAKAQMRILESALEGGVSLRMPKKPNQNGEYEMRDINGNLLAIVKTKQQALDALAVWFKFDEFYALNEILVNVDNFVRKPMTPAIFKIIDELVTSYKNIAEKFLSTSKNEEEKKHVREVLNTYIVQLAQQASHPNVSVEALGQGKRGGMMKVNPLAQPTPKEIVTKAVQAKLDTANAIRATSITNKDGHKSMEKIMNEVALELGRAGKAGAVTYLNELRAPFESRDEYKQDDSTARNQIARELGFTIKGGTKRGGMYGNPPPSQRAEAIRAYFARNPHLRSPELGQAPVQTTNPLRQATAPRAPAAPADPAVPVVPNNGVAEVVQAGCNVLGSCFGTGKRRGGSREIIQQIQFLIKRIEQMERLIKAKKGRGQDTTDLEEQRMNALYRIQALQNSIEYEDPEHKENEQEDADDPPLDDQDPIGYGRRRCKKCGLLR